MNNRLQKKCFFAATGFHLLLLTILIVGPAFFLSERKAEDLPMLAFVPQKTIDEALSGGGSPQARPPAPQPPTPQAEEPAPAPPPPVPVRQPDPPKVVVKETKPDPESLEVKPETKPRKPKISLKPVVRKSNTPVKVASNAAANAEAKARAEATAKRIAAFKSSVNNISAGLSSSTTVEMPGPGGGGPSYANFLQAVRKVYTDAWLLPDGITDDEATVTTSVTIARNGNVIATKILRTSGNAAVDASVEAMLRRVRHAVPLPDSAKESSRTVTIKFNVKAKLNG